MTRQRPRVEIIKSGEKVTLKHFKNNATKFLVENSVTKKEIVDSKILTSSEFNELIKTHKLPTTTKGQQIYANRINFLKALKKYKSTKT